VAAAKRKAKRTRDECAVEPRISPEVQLLQGDCFELLGELGAESIDAIVTDPPYGIGFKQARWDSVAIQEATAKAGLDRATPNEAFESWSCIWATECRRVLKPGGFLAAFGSPRTFHRLTCGVEDAGLEIRDTLMWLYSEGMPKSCHYPGGRATALKPAFEPIVLARRGLDGTTAETITRHGTGALNIESCRVEGRHPANVVLEHESDCEEGRCAAGCAAAAVDECGRRDHVRSAKRIAPSRFLYCPKASRAERDAGCERLPQRALDLFPNAKGAKKAAGARNPHPTVKPLELMRWLVRLLCPPGGLLLDPTAGSGTTGAAAALEGRRFLGIELEPAYIEIAQARIAYWSRKGQPT
jgi:site-specific DNA-methyltransferase (adenine-specific)